ncbi:MAG: hypothetical protein CMJ18_12525 [Phycisphaeraceae bacterium]|nr:hypothetical protein [Phycisphaeraceae bacterium]
MLTACGGPRNFLNENDRLRRQNLELNEQIEKLQAQIESRIQEIDALQAQQEQGGAAARIDGADPPRLSRLRFGRYSGPVDSDGDGQHDQVRIYLHTLDQHGRFVPVSGRAVVRANIATANAAPGTIASRAWEPPEFDQSYRSGITGTHYTLELDLPAGAAGVERIQLYVALHDAATGLRHAAEKSFEMSAGR